MRVSLLSSLAGAALLAAVPLASAQAMSAKPVAVAANSPAIVHVSGGCGWHWHIVPGHHNHWGRWVPRHCSPNL